MALEDLCEDMMLEDREGKNIPGQEKSQCRGPEMEEKVCSRHGTRDTTAEAWRTRGKEVRDKVGEEGAGPITGSCELQ